MAASEKHCKGQEQRNVLSHEGYGGSSPFDRIKAAGFSFSSASENVAQGQGSVDSVFNDWEKSPGHYANMIDPKTTMIGLARSGDYWTMNMGSPSGYESCIKNYIPAYKHPSADQNKSNAQREKPNSADFNVTQGQNGNDTATQGASFATLNDFSNGASSYGILLVASFLMPSFLSIIE